MISHVELAAVGIIDVGCDFVERLDVAAKKFGRCEIRKVGRIIGIDFVRSRARIAGLLFFLLAFFPLFPLFFFFLFAFFHQSEEDEPPLGQFEVNGYALAQFLSIADEIELIFGKVFFLRCEQGRREQHSNGAAETNFCDPAHFALIKRQSLSDVVEDPDLTAQ